MRNAIDHADLSYEVAVYDDADRCTGRQRVGTGTRTSDPETTTIAAARWQTIETISHQPNHMICRDRWTFAPVAGRSYLAYTTSKPTGCTTMIYDMTDPDAIRIEPTLRRRDSRNNVCQPLAQAKQIKLDSTQHSVDSSDLPIPPATQHAPSMPSQAPVAQVPAAKASGGTPGDDLQGLINH